MMVQRIGQPFIGHREHKFIGLYISRLPAFQAGLDQPPLMRFKDISFFHEVIQLTRLNAFSEDKVITVIAKRKQNDHQDEDNATDNFLFSGHNKTTGAYRICLFLRLVSMKTFATLTPAEQSLFLKYPVYLVLLITADDASAGTGLLSSFCHEAGLADFYSQAIPFFEQNFDTLGAQLPGCELERIAAIKLELRKIKELLRKFDPDYAVLMHQSMKAFKAHVSAANEHLLDDFIYPIPIKGLTDKNAS